MKAVLAFAAASSAVIAMVGASPAASQSKSKVKPVTVKGNGIVPRNNLRVL